MAHYYTVSVLVIQHNKLSMLKISKCMCECEMFIITDGLGQ